MSRLLALLAALVLIAACENKGNDQGDEPAQTTGTPGGIPLETPRGEPMIPAEEFSEFEKLADGFIRPYFDEEGTLTELAVTPGEQFHIWVFAEFKTTHPMSAAEYKLILPEGITVIGSSNTENVLITMGKWHTDFSMAFRCMEGPKHWLVKYICMADESFAGGKVRTTEGHVQDYLGFTMCDAAKTMIRAKPGEATLRKK